MFGEVRSGDVSSSVAGGGFGLHGMWLDEGTGLYYVRARTYDARTGRFLSRDPVAGLISNPETSTPYTFDRNNPHVWRDPSGELTLIELQIVTVIIGILASTAVSAFFQVLSTGSVDAGELAIAGFVGGVTAFAALGIGTGVGLMALGAGSSTATLLLNDIYAGEGLHSWPEYFVTALLGAIGGRIPGRSWTQTTRDSLFQIDGALITRALKEMGVRNRLNLIFGLRALKLQFGGLLVSSLPVTRPLHEEEND